MQRVSVISRRRHIALQFYPIEDLWFTELPTTISMLAYRDDTASRKLKLCDSLSFLFDFSQIGMGTALAVVFWCLYSLFR